jgi:hypothetical protein
MMCRWTGRGSVNKIEMYRGVEDPFGALRKLARALTYASAQH